MNHNHLSVDRKTEYLLQRENSLWCIDLGDVATDVSVQPSQSKLVSGVGDDRDFDKSSQPTVHIQQGKKQQKKIGYEIIKTNGDERPNASDVLFGRGRG